MVAHLSLIIEFHLIKVKMFGLIYKTKLLCNSILIVIHSYKEQLISLELKPET